MHCGVKITCENGHDQSEVFGEPASQERYIPATFTPHRESQAVKVRQENEHENESAVGLRKQVAQAMMQTRIFPYKNSNAAQNPQTQQRLGESTFVRPQMCAVSGEPRPRTRRFSFQLHVVPALTGTVWATKTSTLVW